MQQPAVLLERRAAARGVDDDGLQIVALEKFDARKCKAVELRYFGGLSTEEIAEALDVSPVTVRRDLRMAEAWLQRSIEGG